VFFLLLVFVLTGMALTVLLWVITVFLQGYYYTEPTSGIAWQAPAAGFGLSLFLTLWCFLIVNNDSATPSDLPSDTLFRFSPKLYQEPPKDLWVVRKGGKETVHYKLKKDWRPGSKSFYVEASVLAPRPWNQSGVEAIILKHGPESSRFVPTPTGEGQYYQEYSDENGWVIRVFPDSGPDRPYAFRTGLFLGNLVLNLTHFGLWFVAFGLVLRFQWTHALLLAIILWLVMTLAILPMLLDQAAAESVSRRAPASVPKADRPVDSGQWPVVRKEGSQVRGYGSRLATLKSAYKASELARGFPSSDPLRF
jgi:hypothetical protein